MNKFLILMVALVCIFKFSNAQTEKGNQTAGLNLSFSGSQYDENYFDNSNFATRHDKMKNSNFTLGPLYSYFIADGVDVGASFSLRSYTNSSMPIEENLTGNKNYNKSYDLIVYARKYFLYANKIGVRTGPYIGYNWANQGYGYTDNMPDANTSDSKSHGYEAGATLEAVFFPSKRFGISAMIANLQYEHFTGKTIQGAAIDRTNGNNVSLSFINSGLGLSVFYVFGK